MLAVRITGHTEGDREEVLNDRLKRLEEEARQREDEEADINDE